MAGGRISALTAACLAAWVLGCSSQPDAPEALLRARFPARAATVLGDGERAFVRSEDGFSLRDLDRAAPAPLRGLSVDLPASAEDAVRLGVPGFEIRVREAGVSGPGRSAAAAVAYPHSRGTAYWSATDRGVEEWLLVEGTGGEVGRWTVAGGTPRLAGEFVEILDGEGRARLRVRADEAYAAETGARIRAELRVEGQDVVVASAARGLLLVDPLWTTARSLAISRNDHTTTLLPDGRVLAVGGYTTGPDASAELYSPATGTWTTAAPMRTGRAGHTATLLPNGRVLVAGASGDGTPSSTALCEVFDPLTNSWSDTGSMVQGRTQHSATLLRSGKVLVVGGSPGPTAAAELYDPATGAWSATAPMSSPRYNPSAALLPDGTVLVYGGGAEIYDPRDATWRTPPQCPSVRGEASLTVLRTGKVLLFGGYESRAYLSSAWLYDPQTQQWSATGAAPNPRANHTAALLPNGKVLVVGGVNWSMTSTRTADLYDPATGTWSRAGTLASDHVWFSSTLLPDGSMLTIGDLSSSAVERYDAADVDGTWSPTSSMAAPRNQQTATLLPTGKVLLVGGNAGLGAHSSAELYDPASGTFSATPAPRWNHSWHTSALMANGKILVAGGYESTGQVLATAEQYDPAANAWAAVDMMNTARFSHTATPLAGGKILVAGGLGSSTAVLASAELFDPVSATWTDTGSLSTARQRHTATLLADGRVLVVGGSAGGASAPFASAELYDPASGLWATTGSLTYGRLNHTATLLPNGSVLVAGGHTGSPAAQTATAEIYDPSSGTWASTGAMTATRSIHAATLLASGKVLVSGGMDPLGRSARAETFDPATGTWTAYRPLSTTRVWHSASLLPNGKVLVAGGDGQSETTAELFDEGRGTLAQHAPVLLGKFPVTRPGGALIVPGARLTGQSEGSGGQRWASPTNYPLFRIERPDGETPGWAALAAFDDASATIALPAALLEGPYWIRPVVSGALGSAQPILVSAALGAHRIALATGDQQTALAGASLPAPLVVKVTDESGRPVPSFAVSWRSLNGGAVSPAISATDASGLASTAATLGPALGVQGFIASAPGLLGSPVSFTATTQAGAPAKLAFRVQPASVAAGAPISPAVEVEVQDAGGLRVTDSTEPISLSLSTNPGSATLAGGEATAAVGGVAVFANVVLDRAASGYRLAASAGALATAVSEPFDVVAGSATTLAVAGGDLQVGFVGGGLPEPLVVLATDAYGNPVHGVAIDWTTSDGMISPASGVTGSNGTAAALATLGTIAGTQRFVATAGGVSGAQATFLETAAAEWPEKLAFVQQPASAMAGAPFSPEVRVAIQDVYGNVAMGSNAPIALSLVANPAGGALSGATAANASAGLARFPGLSIDKSGAAFLLSATSAGLGAATSAPIDVRAGDAATMTLVDGDGQSGVVRTALAAPLRVRVSDRTGNPVPGVRVDWAAVDGGNVTPPASTTGADGLASGSVVLGPAAGAQRFTASVNGVSPVSFVATARAGPAVRLAFGVQPSNALAGAAITPAVRVFVQDSSGNVVPGSTASISLALDPNPAGASLAGTTQAAAVSGAATFSDLRLDRAGTGYTLRATAPSLTDAISDPFAIAAAVPARLALTGVPSSIAAGAPLALTIDVEDAAGNRVVSYAGTVAISASDPGAVLADPVTFTSSDRGTRTLSRAVVFTHEGAQTLSVSDVADPALSGAVLVQVQAARAPFLLREANPKGAVGVPYRYNALGALRAIGAEPLSYGTCGVPDGLRVEPVGGALRWVPRAEGPASVCVRASNELGEDTYTFTVEVAVLEQASVAAAFEASPDSGPPPLFVQFDAAPTVAAPGALPLSFVWDFGDWSRRATGPQVGHLFQLPGSYRPRLEAFDAFGDAHEAVRTIAVLGPNGARPPSVAIVASQTRGTGSLDVQFGLEEQEGSAPVVAHRWDLGNGETDSTRQPAAHYGPGRYRVRVVAVDASGLAAHDEVEVVVAELDGSLPPECHAVLSPSVGSAPLDVVWTAEVASPGGEWLTWRWDFEGEHTEALTVSRRYEAAGRYRGRLTVTDASGTTCRDAAELVVLSADGLVPPQIATLPEGTAYCGVQYRYRAVAEGSAPLRWRLVEATAPQALLDGKTGDLYWTPTPQDSGAQRFVIEVENGAGTDRQELVVATACDTRLSFSTGCGCGAAGGGAGLAAAAGLALSLLLRRRR